MPYRYDNKHRLIKAEGSSCTYNYIYLNKINRSQYYEYALSDKNIISYELIYNKSLKYYPDEIKILY